MTAARPVVDPHTADELLGNWWLPDEPARKVPGTLRFPAEGPIELDLMDLLADGNTDQRHPVVLGITADGIPVTLDDLQWVAGYDVRLRQVLLEHPMRRETFGVDVAFIGAHLPSESDRAFSDAVVDFTDLLSWSGPSGLSGELGPAPGGYSIQLVSPAPREARLPFGTVALSHGWKTTGDGRRSHGIEKEVGFAAHMDAAGNLESWLRMVIGPLRHLLTFATDRPNEVSRLTFTQHRDERVGERIAVRYARSPAAATTDARPHEFLFDAGTLDDDFEPALVRWFGMIGDIGPIIDMLLAQRYRSEVFAENRFLDACGAAESYHRARIARETLPRSEHEARVAAILDNAPEEHRKWLGQKLQYSNEPSLHRRLKELVASSPAASLDLFGSPSAFAAPVVETRSMLAHDPRRRAEMSLSGQDLLRMTEQLTFLVSAFLLRDLGFDDIRVTAMLRRTRRFRRLTEVFRP